MLAMSTSSSMNMASSSATAPANSCSRSCRRSRIGSRGPDLRASASDGQWQAPACQKRIDMSPPFPPFDDHATAQKVGLAEDPARGALSLKINGRTYSVEAPDDMPLLWVLRDLL